MRQSRYETTAAADGTRLAFRAVGEGPPLVFTNGYTTTADYYRHLIGRLRDRTRCVTWDLKGHGASEGARSLDAVTIVDCVDDLQRVMDAAGVERATLVGFSMGCQIVLEAWRHIPDRIEAIVPMLGLYGQPFDNLIHPRLGPVLGKVLDRGRPLSRVMLKAAWLGTRSKLVHKANQLTGMVGPTVSREDMAGFYDNFKAMDGPTWAAMGVAAQSHSAADLLETITVPTLVVSGGRDTFTPHHLSEEMVRRIPGCEHLHLAEATHTGLFEYPDEIGRAIEDFLHRHGVLADADGEA